MEEEKKKADGKTYKFSEETKQRLAGVTKELGVSYDAAEATLLDLWEKQNFLNAHPDTAKEFEAFYDLTRALTTKFRAKSEDCETAEERIRANFERDLSELTERARTAEEKAKSAVANEENAIKQTKIAEARAELAVKEESIANAKVITLEKTLDEKQRSIDALLKREDPEKLRAELNTANEELSQMKIEISSISKDLAVAEKEIGRLTEEFEKATGQIGRLEEKNDALVKEKDVERAKRMESESAARDAGKEIESLNKEKAKAEKDSADLIIRMEKCSEELAAEKEKTIRLEREIAAREKEIAVKEKEIDLAYARGKEEGRKEIEEKSSAKKKE